MRLERREDGCTKLVINAHGSAAPLYEIEPDVVPSIGPVIHFYRSNTEPRVLLLTLSRNGAIGLLKFLPTLVNEAGRLERRKRRTHS